MASNKKNANKEKKPPMSSGGDLEKCRKALAQAETKADLLELIPTPVMTVDKEFNVTYLNPAGASAVGKTVEACLGQKCYSLFNTKHCNTSDCRVAKAMQQDGVFTGDTLASLPSGALPIRYTGVALKDERGDIVGGLEYVLNIAEESKAVAEVMELVEAAVAGKLDARGNPDNYSIAGFKNIVKGINDTLDAVIGPLNVAAEYVDRISKGDIPHKITDEYKGDFNEIKNNLNLMIDRVGSQIENLANIPTPVMTVDKEFNITFMNRTGAKLVGLSPVECEGKKCYDLFKTLHCRTPECRCGQAMQSGETVTGETVASPAGLDVPIQYTGAPVKDRDGNIVGALEYVTDITEVKRAMDDAREKVDFLNNIPTPVMVVDKGFNIRFMNPAGADVVGKTPEACLGQKCFSLFNTGHCNTPDCQLGKAMQQNMLCSADTVAKLPSGEVPIRYMGAPLKDADGNIIGALEYVLDISKEMEVTNGVLDLVGAAVEGKLNTRADAEKHEGNYKQIVKAVNNLVDAFVGPINLTAEYVERISKGDMPEKITDEYKGDFNLIKNNINELIKAFSLITEAAETMAKGDMTVEIQPRSENDLLLKSLSKMVATLNDSLGQVNVAVEQIAAGAGQVSDSAQALSQGATEQASSLEEITSSMNEIGSQTKQNAENATQANQLSSEARTGAEKGNNQMKEMVGAMEEINESSQNISKIIKVIDEIAFQTNLLALNAAVEAARAGKHGKGFAVVAEEVRNLAARSAKAAKETAELIEGSVEKVEQGTQMASKTAEALDEIVAGVTKVTDLVGEIAAASNEQAQGVSQINVGLGQIDQVTQQNTATAEQSASASEELSSQAAQLRDMLAKFKLRLENGKDHTPGVDQISPEMMKMLRKLMEEKPAPVSHAVSKTPSGNAGNGGNGKGGNGKTQWGGVNAAAVLTAGTKQAQPEPVIDLDDKEFGRF